MAYFSKKLNKAQINYTATEKECLAVVKGIDHFAVYLLGRNFLLQTNHKALQQMKMMDNRNQRLMRWALTLQPYNFYIQYRPGRELKNADALSRQNFPELSPGEGGGDVRDEPSLTELLDQDVNKATSIGN